MKKGIVFLAFMCVSTLFAADGASLYKTCATCHGTKGDKSALNGYKDGSYGGPLKGTMAGQVKNLDADAITALAKYIEKL